MKKKFVFALMMGVVTTGIISFTVISVNIGFKPKFFKIWLKSWGLAYLVALPTILVIAPLIQKLVDRLFDEEDKERNLKINSINSNAIDSHLKNSHLQIMQIN